MKQILLFEDEEDSTSRRRDPKDGAIEVFSCMAHFWKEPHSAFFRLSIALLASV